MAKTPNADVNSLILAITDEIAKKFQILHKDALEALVNKFVQDFYKKTEKYLFSIEKIEKNSALLNNIFEIISEKEKTENDNKFYTLKQLSTESNLTAIPQANIKPSEVQANVEPSKVEAKPEANVEPSKIEVKPEVNVEPSKVEAQALVNKQSNDNLTTSTSLENASKDDIILKLTDIQKMLEGVIDTKTSFVREEKYPHLFLSFFKKILKQKPTDNAKKISAQQDKKEEPLADTTEQNQNKESFLEKADTTIPVLFDGFTEKGYSELLLYLPEIIKEGIKPLLAEDGSPINVNQNIRGGGLLDKFSGILPSAAILKGGLSALGIIGGALSLLYGLQTSDAFKGLAKMVGQGSLLIAKKLSPALTKFVANFAKQILDLPLTLLKSFGNTIGKLVTTQGTKILSKIGLESLAKLLPKVVSGIGKALTKIPFIGGLVSLGFAISRLIKGDYVGAGLDVLAGLAMLIPPPFGMMVSFAIDGINAFLDFQSGGIGTEESRAKKSGMVMGVIKWLGSALYTAFTNLPIIGPMLRAFNEFKNDNYEEGIKQLLYINPAFELIGALLGDKSTGGIIQATAWGVGLIGKLIGWVGKTVYKGLKSIPIIGPMLKAAEAFYNEDYVKGIKQLVYINPAFEFIGALLGDKEASGVTKTVASVFRVAGKLIGWLAKTIYKGFKALPIIGPALKAVEEFISGNFGKGFKQLLYINPIFELLGTLLFNDRETTPMAKMAAGIFSIMGKVASWVAKTLWKAISNLPIIGPAIKAVDELFSGNFLKAFKQFAYIFPAFELLGALLGDEDVGGVAKFGAGIIKGIGTIIGKLASWVGEKIWLVMSNLPIVGPAMKAAKEFFSGNYGKAFKQLLYVNPLFEFIGALLGDEDVGGVSAFAAAPFRGVGSLLYNVGKWIKEKLFGMPIIGPIFTGFEQMFSGEGIIKGFKTMAKGIPIIGGIISFLESDETAEDGKEFKGEKFNPFKALKEMVLAKAKKWWQNTWAWVRYLARKVLPTSVIEFLDSDTNKEEDIDTEQETTDSTESVSAKPIKPVSLPEKQEETVPAFERKLNTLNEQNAQLVPLPNQDTLFESDKVLVTTNKDAKQQKDLIEASSITPPVPIIEPTLNESVSLYKDKRNDEVTRDLQSLGIVGQKPTLVENIQRDSEEVIDNSRSPLLSNQPLLNVFVQDFSEELLVKLSEILTNKNNSEKSSTVHIEDQQEVVTPKPDLVNQENAITPETSKPRFVEHFAKLPDKILTTIFGNEKIEKLKNKLRAYDELQKSKTISKDKEILSKSSESLQTSTKDSKDLIDSSKQNRTEKPNLTEVSDPNKSSSVEAIRSKDSSQSTSTIDIDKPTAETPDFNFSDFVIKSLGLDGIKETIESKDNVLLKSIAANTKDTNKNLDNLATGFNNLATALEKLGVSITSQPPSQQTIVAGNQTSQQKGGLGRGTQYGKIGNPAITEFRRMIEMNRQQPV